MPQTIESVDSTLSALADGTRRQIIARLASGPQPAGRLAHGLPMSRPAVSKHLRVLREAGLIESHKIGRQQLYRLAPGGFLQLQAALDEVGRFWASALDEFKQFAESQP
ncbi:MAG: winged helix-turn-helix transcriptional regulator [Chloroflexi bacterium]|nr:winged helix-turn-helix transcriptional regulator [Chloroflexota bacterium]